MKSQLIDFLLTNLADRISSQHRGSKNNAHSLTQDYPVHEFGLSGIVNRFDLLPGVPPQPQISIYQSTRP